MGVPCLLNVYTGTKTITKCAIRLDSRKAFLFGNLYNNQVCMNII